MRILEYARKVGVDRVLYTQTWAEMAGYWGKGEIFSPQLPRKLKYTGDQAFYAITKCMIVDTMEYYKQEYGIKNFVFRLPNVYLYHPDTYYYVECKKKLVAYRYMINQVENRKDIEMWGNPDAFEDILYVKDLCQKLLKFQIKQHLIVLSWIYLMQKKKKNWDTSRNIHILKYIEDYKKEKQLKRFDVLWKE